MKIKSILSILQHFMAIEAGISKDPTLVLNGKIFLEGLTQAEDITKAFEELLK